MSTRSTKAARRVPLDERTWPPIDDLDDGDAPPISGKVHPSEALHAPVPALDDELRAYHHHPNEPGNIEFEVDPEAGDAAADLAGDLGSEFLEGATKGQDMSDVVMSRDDAEGDLPLLLEEPILSDALYDEDEEQASQEQKSPKAPGRKKAS